MYKNSISQALTPSLILLFFPNFVFAQIPQKVPKKNKVPHKYISRVHFLNGAYKDYDLLHVFSDGIEVKQYSKKNKLEGPYSRNQFPTETLKFHYPKIDHIVISRKNPGGHGFLVGAAVGVGVSLILTIIAADTDAFPEGGIGTFALLSLPVTSFMIGNVGGFIGLMFKKRKKINGRRKNFEMAKPFLQKYQHFK